MTSPVPGWYPDPSGRPGERWWNGVSWSDATRQPPTPTATPTPTYAAPTYPAPGPAGSQPAGAAPAVPVPTGPAEAPYGWDGFGNPAPPREPVPGPGHPATTPVFPNAGPSAPGAPGGQGGQGLLWARRNGFSLTTIVVAAVYFLILVYAGHGLVGILPLFLGLRAVGRREPLRWVAVGVGVIALVIGLVQFGG